MPCSPKQDQSIWEANKRLNVWIGAVRSGKTYSSIMKFIDLLKNAPEGNCMIIGVNRDTIQRNVLLELYKFLGFPCPGTKTTETKLYGRNVYFVGAHDEGSVRRIQGSTLSSQCYYPVYRLKELNYFARETPRAHHIGLKRITSIDNTNSTWHIGTSL